jgi:hypothetical protein
MTRALPRLLAAAIAVAFAIYLVPASVHIVAWNEQGVTRLAILSPASRLIWSSAMTLASFAALAAWAHATGTLERLPYVTAPLTLLALWIVPFVPWAATRAPLLLVLAGPARWAIAAFAAAWCVARALGGRRLPRLALPRWAIVVLSVTLYLGLGLRFSHAAGFGGDEPHYLVITHSLLVDHDLDIANNHEHRDYRAFYAGELRPDYLQRAQNGAIYSIHAPGLPALLVLPYAAAGATGALAAMAVMAALTALAIFDLAALLAGPHTATLVWAGVGLTVPFLPHAWLIYPELPGALIVAWSALWLWQSDTSDRRALVHGLLLALLPWLHTKFVVLLALLAALYAVRLWPRIRRLALFSTPIALSLACWLYFFYRTYGTLDPEAPYGSSTQLNVLAQNIPHGVLGLLFDQKFGLFIYSPVYLLALAGFVIMWRDRRLRTFGAGIALAAAAFLLSTTRFYMWWGGSSAPARFLVPLIPLFAAAIAIAIDRLRGIGGRALVAGTMTVSIAVAIVCLWTPRASLLFNDPHGRSALVEALQGGAPLDYALPTFTEEQWRAPLLLLAVWLTATAIGLALTAVAVRRGAVKSSWGAAATLLAIFGVAASAFDGGRESGRDPSRRSAIVARGQSDALRAFDAADVRAFDPDRIRRVAGGDLDAELTTVERRDAANGDAADLGGPFTLPEGDYEARVWFAGDRPTDGAVRVLLSRDVILARATTPLANPATLRFRMLVPASVRVDLAGGAQAAAQRVEVAPLRLSAGTERSGLTISAIERVEGRPASYMAYADADTYPEGGVFWTRGTETAHLVLVPDGARVLHLILHVGPNGGPVTAEVGTVHIEANMAPGETRDVQMVLPPGAATVPLSIRAAGAFRPSDSEAGSDDRRWLGCQVRPRLD